MLETKSIANYRHLFSNVRLLAIDEAQNIDDIGKKLKLIAFQIGSLVSYDEIGRHLGLSKNTVEKHLDLLSKVFVIFRLGAFSSNGRKEITKSGKWYFVDNGIRNAIVDNFKPLSVREDVGALWKII